MLDNIRIPSLIAVPLWVGSALAVLGYTYIAFKETADGSDQPVNSKLSAKQSEQELQGLLAKLPELKPLDRERFKKSGEK